MPTPSLMKWVPSRKSWVKQYRGQRVWVSCRQLGCEGTKEASIAAANAWWRDRQTEIDIAYRESVRKPAPMEDLVLAGLLSRFVPDVAAAQRLVEEAEGSEDGARLCRREVMLLLEGLLFDDGTLPSSLPPGRVQTILDAAKAIRGEAVAAPGRTVREMIDAWFLAQNAKARSGMLSPDRVHLSHTFVERFGAFLGETQGAAAINAASLRSYYHDCLSLIAEGRAEATAKQYFNAARAWIRWLVDEGIIEAPKNLGSRDFRFNVTAKEIQTWTPAEVRSIIAQAPGKLPLALLLMANCGMTQQDVSDLKDSEIDWREGRITRKRSKTKSRKGTPTVSYKLWPMTFALLKKHRSGAEHVILTESGRPFVRKELKNGKLVKADGFASCWKPFANRIGFKKSMKLLRKTSASLLETHEVYGRFTTLFLGHSPASIKDRHYSAPPQQLFDEAITWLGAQLGVAAGQ